MRMREEGIEWEKRRIGKEEMIGREEKGGGISGRERERKGKEDRTEEEKSII